MKDTISEKSKAVKTCRVRFVRPVKMAGHWYGVGEEVSLSSKLARDFERRGLVESLSRDKRIGEE